MAYTPPEFIAPEYLGEITTNYDDYKEASKRWNAHNDLVANLKNCIATLNIAEACFTSENIKQDIRNTISDARNALNF